MPAAKLGSLRLHLANIARLVVKELRSIRADPIMLALIVYSFTVSVNTVATGASTEARNLAVGVVDEDHSVLWRQLRDALLR
jgi:ABC-2 type transport system permease protein